MLKKKRGQFGFGSVWTWVAIDADTKLVPSFLVGNRDVQSAHMFMQDLAHRIDSRIQLTTDGLRAYLIAVNGAFGLDVDFATLHKTYGLPAAGEGERRYTPPVCIGCKAATITGNPDPEHISTSYVERQNLTMRMSMRRFTRLTNAFSKKVDNLAYHVALYFMYYNFCRVHQTLRVTPAMEAGISDRVWEVEEILSIDGCQRGGELGGLNIKLAHYPRVAKGIANGILLCPSDTQTRSIDPLVGDRERSRRAGRNSTANVYRKR